MYKYFAFDFFDTVMCSGKHQIESIRQLEKLRKTKKELLQTGLTYFDVLENENKQQNISKNKNTSKKVFSCANLER